jgi:surfeit locus 1 family protein
MKDSFSRLRPLLGAGLATLAALAILVFLGAWQLERRAWKQDLVARIEARAHGEPDAIVPEPRWPEWRAQNDEFRAVRLTGTALHDKEVLVHGLMSGQPGSPLQGFYVFTPVRLASGAIVMLNRGFVPGELRDPAMRRDMQASDAVSVTGLMRAPEARGWFMPENRPELDQWFTRDIAAMAQARGLERVAPFWVDTLPAPTATAWPRPGQTRLSIPNNHLQYALTWFGLALTLLGVFGAWAWKRTRAEVQAVPDPAGSRSTGLPLSSPAGRGDGFK